MTVATQSAADRLAGELISIHGLGGAAEVDRPRVRQWVAGLCRALAPRLMNWVPLAEQRAPLSRLVCVLEVDRPLALLAELARDPLQGSVMQALARELIDALDAGADLAVCRAGVTVVYEDMTHPRVLPDPGAETTKPKGRRS